MPLPWASLLMFAPQVIDLSRELLKRSRRQPEKAVVPADEPDVILRRLAALEENEQRQAELVERMATQQAELTRAVVALHRRVRWLSAALVLLAVLLAWQIFFAA